MIYDTYLYIEYCPPSGFKALSEKNLDAIAQ